MNATAPPVHTLQHWKPIAGLTGVWEIRRTRGPMPLRAVAVQLQDNRTCVYSPVPRAGEAALDELRSIGEPIFLAPNAFHTLGLREHANAFPKAAVVTSNGAFGRVKKKTKLPIQDFRLLDANLPAHISTLQLPHVRSGEVWLSIRDEARRAWVVCDAFVNLQSLQGGAMSLVAKLMRMGPGLSIPMTFKLLLTHRRAYREWLLTKIAEDCPTILIPCHGQVLTDDELPSRLERLVREKL
jgi:hypothetical protein